MPMSSKTKQTWCEKSNESNNWMQFLVRWKERVKRYKKGLQPSNDKDDGLLGPIRVPLLHRVQHVDLAPARTACPRQRTTHLDRNGVLIIVNVNGLDDAAIDALSKSLHYTV